MLDGFRLEGLRLVRDESNPLPLILSQSKDCPYFF